VHVEPSHWLHEISISKTVHHHINWGYLFSIKDAIFTRVRIILKNFKVFTTVGANSPVTSSANIKIFSGQSLDRYIRNVVYKEVLEL
jgi:hypothetical protein